MRERAQIRSDKITGLSLLRERFRDLEELEGEHRQTEEALRSTEEIFRLLVEGVADYAIFLLDAHGYVVSWNSGAERMKGYRAKEVIGKHISAFYPAEEIALGRPGQHLAIAAREGRFQDEGWRVRKDGEKLWVNVVITAMRSNDGRILGFSNVARDLSERRILEEKILQDRNLLQNILAHSPSLIFVKGGDGRYLLVNTQFEKQFGIPSSSIIGRTDAEIFPPEQAARFAENDQLVLKSGLPLSFEEEASYEDGPHTSIVVKYPLFTSDGILCGIGGIVTDISERKRIEKALRAGEQMLRELVDALPTAVYVCNSSGFIESYNRKAADLWGREPKCGAGGDRFCGSPKLCRVDGSPLPHAESPMAQVLRTGAQHLTRELLIERPDGSRRKVMVDIVPRRDERGVMTGAINCLTDITGLTVAEARFKGLLEAAPDGMIIADSQGKIRIVNSQTEKMFGYEREELYGLSIESLVPARYRRNHPGHRHSYGLNPRARTMGEGLDLFGLRKDGSEFPVDISLSPFRAEGEQLVIAAVRDITERKKAEVELQESHGKLRALTARLESVREEEKSRLALEMHDQLGQILTAVKMDLGQLRHELRSRKALVRTALEQELNSAFHHIDESIDAVRNIAFDLKPSVLIHFGLKEAIKDHVKSFELRTRIACSFSAPSRLDSLTQEQSVAVFRVLQEALTNVARHSGGKKVQITLRKRKGWFVVEIRDSGKGIAESRIGASTSFGILGMQERAAMLGGSLVVARGKRRGTIVQMRIPFENVGRRARG